MALSTAALSACTAAPQEKLAAPPPRRVTLAANLDSPTDITLRWSGRDPGAAGHVVEFATERQGPYTILQFAQPAQASYTHPDLMPTTPFFYRLRPYYGPASTAVELALPPGEFTEKDQQGDHEWAVPKKRPGTARPAGPAPTALKATVKHANGVQLTWQDHALDEEGYLIEVRASGARDFRVAAVVDPDVESAGLITLPEEKRATVRVRAYRYGSPSNIVHRMTGPENPGP
ncbi:fibronectin type III domain-containing protein [Streptomyces sp. NPDC020681]|uniref:fibronectin type III domain-containing protein n=1 Tax=Streptomyces sp. NPDC020681 TaxID=3365083 RepID=UPI0037A6B427